MRLVKRAAITVTPKQPYIDWANGLDEDGVKIGEDFEPEKSVYLIGDVSDVIPFDRDVIVLAYFKAIFEEELNSWHRWEREWPFSRTYETFLKWFEVAVHSMVLDLQGSWLIRTEGYSERRRSSGFPPVVVMQVTEYRHTDHLTVRIIGQVWGTWHALVNALMGSGLIVK